MQCLDALGRRGLHGLHHVEGKAVWIVALGAVARSRQGHAPGAEPQPGAARLLARLGADRHRECAARVKRRIEQALLRGQRPVLRNPHDQPDIFGPAREHRVDVGLPVADHDHLARRPETRRRRHRPVQPAPRLLVREATLATVRLRRAIARPYRSIDQTQNRLIIGVHRHHGMDEKAKRLAIARRAKPAPGAVTPREVHLRGVLNRNHPTPRTRLRGAPRQRVHDRLGVDPLVVQEAMAGDFAGTVAAKAAQHQRARRHNPVHQPITAISQADIANNHWIHTTLRQNRLPHRIRLNHKPSRLAIPRITCVHPVAPSRGRA